MRFQYKADSYSQMGTSFLSIMVLGVLVSKLVPGPLSLWAFLLTLIIAIYTAMLSGAQNEQGY